MGQSRLKQEPIKAGRYDVSTECPICGEHVFWVNGSSNSGLVYIRSKRKTVNIYHEKCIEREWREFGSAKVAK